MNLLVVDDNKNNRMILSLLLEDYMDEKGGVTFAIDEAVDGVEAVSKCDAKEYDIVFMDIMMPNLDGIEATKQIRQKHKKVMIIAVSAVDDYARQKEILNNGAEDYVSKPVNADIFNTRLENYIRLVEARKHHGGITKSNEDGINLFTKDIFSRYTNFIIKDEDTLSELWEHYLLSPEEKCDNLSDVIRTLFSVAEVQLKLKVDTNIYEEESEEYKYFTIVNIDKIPQKIIPLILKKNEVKSEYMLEADRLSFRLTKIVTEVVAFEERGSVTTSAEVKEEVVALESQALQVFDYIDEYDMDDLEEYAGRLSSLMLIVGSGDVEENEVIEIYTYIEKLGAILSSYAEVYPISQALSTLAADMASHVEEFIKNSEALGPMCAAFSKDLTNWIEMSFHTGAPSVDFMNDTIVVNCQTIGSMLKMDEVAVDAGDDFDDIFDF